MRAPLLLTTLFALVGASASNATSACERNGFFPGETFSFRLFIGTIESGRARLAFSRPTATITSGPVVVVGQLETLPWLSILVRLKNDYRVLFDPTTLLATEVRSVERGRGDVVERDLSSHFLRDRVSQTLVTPKGKELGTLPLPGVTRDPLTALLTVRAARLAEGDSLTFLVLDRSRLWRSRVVAHHEHFFTRTGAARPAVNAIRLDGENQPADGRRDRPARQFHMWLSDDTHRVLLRMEAETDIGPASVELANYGAGDTATTCADLPLPGVVAGK